jgi:pyrimidine operon attenuation protein / uracil phosphoribosyltransferase
MGSERIIIENKKFQLTIERLCHRLIEEYDDFQNTSIIGIQPRGVLLSDRITNRLQAIQGEKKFDYGKIDITFFRDDFRRRDKPLTANINSMDFEVENKKVILIDDVLYTGRSVHAAIAALLQYGRPASIELLVLVDRSYNRDFPIQANYVGITVDSIDEDYVKVEWSGENEQDRVVLFQHKNDEYGR